MQANYRNLTGVIVTAGVTANSLGVVRSFDRRGIRVIYLDTERGSIARYSKYINQRLKCRSPRESETELISILLRILHLFFNSLRAILRIALSLA